jgi:phosphatidylserine decarboxylase
MSVQSGYFMFGGSDFVMIFQDKVNFGMTAPNDNGGSTYQHLLMGEAYGKLTTKWSSIRK